MSANTSILPVSTSVVPPPTKREAIAAMAQALADHNKASNLERQAKIDAAREKLHVAIAKAAEPAIRKAKKSVSWWRSNDVNQTSYSVGVDVTVKIEGSLVPLKAALNALIQTERLEEDPLVIARLIRERFGGKVGNQAQRVAAILSTPAVKRKLAQEAERILRTPAESDKVGALEVEGGAA